MVEIMTNRTTGLAVNRYASSTKNFGFVNIQSQEIAFNGNRLNTEVRSCLLRGNVDELQNLINSKENGKLPGRIRVYEVLENIARDVAMGINTSETHSIAKTELHSELLKTDFESAISGYIKKNPSTDEVLKADGQRILRFQVYDPTSELSDVLIKHDRDDVPNTSSGIEKNEVIAQE